MPSRTVSFGVLARDKNFSKAIVNIMDDLKKLASPSVTSGPSA